MDNNNTPTAETKVKGKNVYLIKLSDAQTLASAVPAKGVIVKPYFILT
jgi:hypothetical protein